MTVTRETVKKIAGLAKINLREEELERLTAELGQIAVFADKLAELDGEAADPTTYAIQIPTVYREDEIIPPPPRDVMLANAPERDETSFLTPKILE